MTSPPRMLRSQVLAPLVECESVALGNDCPHVVADLERVTAFECLLSVPDGEIPAEVRAAAIARHELGRSLRMAVGAPLELGYITLCGELLGLQ